MGKVRNIISYSKMSMKEWLFNLGLVTEIMDDDEDDESEALDASSSPVGSELPEGVPSTTTTTTQTIEGGLPPTQPS